MDAWTWTGIAVGVAVVAAAGVVLRRRLRVRPDADWAACYDFRSRSVSYVPRHKLKPGWIQARIHNLEGLFWVDPAQMKEGRDRVAPPLDDAMRAALADIAARLHEVHPLSAEQWEDRVRRAADPTREVARWQAAAAAYARETEGRDFNATQRRDVLSVVLGALERGPEALKDVRLDALARTTAQGIAARVHAGSAGERLS